jgi:16S rRNA pseudouridine516 synthase
LKAGALAKYIAGLGYGSRREVAALIAEGRVTDAAGDILGQHDEFEHRDVRVDGEPLDPAPGVVLMLNKPIGYVCSTRDTNPVVYDLLPARFLTRRPIIATVGRLDSDTSGLLLMTDDGALNHRITSPRSHLPKVYDATLASALRGDVADIFASGTLMLKGEDSAVMPAEVEVVDDRRARITIREGRYHQVRRMFAAVGNRVESLHRSAIADLTLGDLDVGEWRVLTTAEKDGLESAIERYRTEAAAARTRPGDE